MEHEQQEQQQQQQLNQQESHSPVRTNHLFFSVNEDSYEEESSIDGVVIFVVQEEQVQVSRIAIRWVAREFTNWYEGIKQDKHCTAERIILDNESEIWTSENDQGISKDGIFKKGTYTFPFFWKLPSGIPGSFLDEEGNLPNILPSTWALPKGSLLPKSLYGEKSNITYLGTAFVERQEGEQTSRLLQASILLKVLQKYDPNLLKLKPIEKQTEKANFISFKTSMPLKMSVTLPNGGVAVTGYKFPIQLAIVNGTSFVVRSIKISFRQNIVLSAPGSTFQRQKIVFEGEVPNSLIEKQGHYVKELLIDVPSSIPQSITLGTLVQRHYEVIVELNVSLMSNVTLVFDVRIFEHSRLMKLPPGVVSQPPPKILQKRPSQVEQEEGEEHNHSSIMKEQSLTPPTEEQPNKEEIEKQTE